MSRAKQAAKLSLPLDTDAVANLKKSLQVIGQIYSIVKDGETGEDLSGAHRRAAGAKKEYVLTKDEKLAIAKRINAPVELVPLLFKVHSNVQRQVDASETKTVLLAQAEILVRSGVPKDQIVATLARYNPYTDRWIRELMPDQYKETKFRNKGEVASRLESAGFDLKGDGGGTGSGSSTDPAQLLRTAISTAGVDVKATEDGLIRVAGIALFVDIAGVSLSEEAKKKAEKTGMKIVHIPEGVAKIYPHVIAGLISALVKS